MPVEMTAHQCNKKLVTAQPNKLYSIRNALRIYMKPWEKNNSCFFGFIYNFFIKSWRKTDRKDNAENLLRLLDNYSSPDLKKTNNLLEHLNEFPKKINLGFLGGSKLLDIVKKTKNIIIEQNYSALKSRNSKLEAALKQERQQKLQIQNKLRKINSQLTAQKIFSGNLNHIIMVKTSSIASQASTIRELKSEIKSLRGS